MRIEITKNRRLTRQMREAVAGVADEGMEKLEWKFFGFWSWISEYL